MTKYKTFQSFGEFKTWADNLNDRELMIKILIVEKYQKEIPIILDKINERCRYDPDNADYIFTSTHKVKKILKDRMDSIWIQFHLLHLHLQQKFKFWAGNFLEV